jgi:N-acetylmuramoyl-L-alanine amidase
MYATTIDLDDISNSTMYSQPIHKHTENIDMKRCTKDDLIAYVRELVKDNKPAEETLKSDNLEEIVRDAKQVVHIKIEDPLIKIQTTLKNSETWSCKVIDTLKGDIKEGSTIKIMFIGDVVVPGKEYIVTLEISLKMKTSLEALGAKVVMIREDHNVNISNKERAEIGNNANADVVLRVHCNGAESESAKGIELYVRDKGDNTAAYKERSDYDYSVASELMNYLISATGAKNRGVKRSDNYTGTNWSSVPSVIIECGFMSNEEEDNLLVTEAYQQKFADAVAEWLKNSEIIKK